MVMMVCPLCNGGVVIAWRWCGGSIVVKAYLPAFFGGLIVSLERLVQLRKEETCFCILKGTL